MFLKPMITVSQNFLQLYKPYSYNSRILQTTFDVPAPFLASYSHAILSSCWKLPTSNMPSKVLRSSSVVWFLIFCGPAGSVALFIYVMQLSPQDFLSI